MQPQKLNEANKNIKLLTWLIKKKEREKNITKNGADKILGILWKVVSNLYANFLN